MFKSINNPKPTYYSIVYNGDTLSKIFEHEQLEGNNWNFTDFIST